MKILVINGPNLNMLGSREPEIYGHGTLAQLNKLVKKKANSMGLRVKCVQTNYEGTIITYIQKAKERYDGIIINAGAYSHTSVAILDALKASNIPCVEVHLSDLSKRESFRQHSYVSMYAVKTISGNGFGSYIEALEFFRNNYSHQ